MSVFNPELKEDREGFFEGKLFSSDFERRLLTALDQGKETLLDIVLCPNKACGCPLKVQLLKDAVRAWCPQCGWEQILKQSNNDTTA